MVLTHDSSDTARLIALKLHWIAALLLALEIGTSACKSTPTPTPAPPVQLPGDNDNDGPSPRTSTTHGSLPGAPAACGMGR